MRATAVLGAIVVLLWLTLPAIVSPASVAGTIRGEHRLHAAWLGDVAQHDILARALGWLSEASEAGQNFAPADSPRLDPLSVRIAAAAGAVMQTRYVQSARALGRLAIHRLSALAEWFAVGLPLLVAATIDGALMRTVKLRSFAHPSPVLFGLGLRGTLAVLACMVLALLVPVGLHPLVCGGLVAVLTATLRTAVANVHRVR